MRGPSDLLPDSRRVLRRLLSVELLNELDGESEEIRHLERAKRRKGKKVSPAVSSVSGSSMRL